MVHGVYLLKLGGGALGGFRIASRPWILGGWPAGMRALESAAEEAIQVLMRIPHEELARTPDALPQVRHPRVGDREGFLDAFCVQEDAETFLMVTRAVFRFRWWPFGAWVVFAAFRSRPGGAEPLSDEDVDELW